MRRVVLISLLAVGGFFTLPLQASAQPSPAITEEDLVRYIEIARAQGAPIKEEDVATMIAIARGQQSMLTQMQQELEVGGAEQPVDLTKPLSHVTGKDGIPFPKPEEVAFEPVPTDTPTTEGDAKPAPVWSPKPYSRPAKCEKNETKREETKPGGPESRIFFDELYVSQDLVPLDPQEVFGAKTTLTPYGPSEAPGTFLRMKIDNVPCLPYRIRISERARYYDSGLNALMNYDTNPAGKGKLHKFIEQKLYPQKRSKRDK